MKNIFLAGAHTKDAPLPELEVEIRELKKILTMPLRSVWTITSNHAANLEDVFETFSERSKEIAIFHYAGHANQHELKLEGGGRAPGLSELFGLTQGKTLRLVFLNGCATLGHVDSLHNAGVAAVIATNRPVNDELARVFAEHFYKIWATDSITLEHAFNNAKAFVHSKPDGEHRSIEIATRSVGRDPNHTDEPSPWRLWLNPQLNETEAHDIRNWQLLAPVKLAPQVLEKVETVTSESLRKIAYEFCKSDPEARKKVDEENCSELMALIMRLPWTVGTHLRRLVALDKRQSMTQDTKPRLREIANGYTELTRFICYTALSALWEDSLSHERKIDLSVYQIFPEEAHNAPPDFILLLKEYHKILLDIPGDAIQLEANISNFLSEVEGRLSSAYQFMERLNGALAQSNNPDGLDNFIANNSDSTSNFDAVCRKAEAAFAQFIKAALFLTHYTMHSVRGISVDKVRFLTLDDLYVHKTISLHAAFSEPETKATNRKIASDNYSILLAPRVEKGQDPFTNALNLSPFYIDKHALIAEKREDYPAIFVLKNKYEAYNEVKFDNEKYYIYDYLDLDVNHKYLAPEDHQLNIDIQGLMQADLPKDGPHKQEDTDRFRQIYEQLENLSHDLKGVL